MSDKRALKILFDKYWSSTKGWQNNILSAEDFECAKKAGVMFDDVSFNHDEIVQKALEQCNSISKAQVVESFLSSLSTRRLELRSALSSFACGCNLPLHKFTPQENNIICSVCSEIHTNKSVDLNILNFERNKFGGVRHLRPTYINLDISLFSKMVVPKPTKSDVEILKSIIASLAALTSNKISDAEKAIKNSMQGNKNERVNIIATMGYCGILNIPNYEPFYKSYISVSERAHSNYSKSDWPFPADLWLPVYGLNQEAIQYWFGAYIS